MTHPGKYAVCIIGLGAMGMGAARSCLRAGLTTYGADLNPQALAVLQQAGAKQTAPSARDFATELDAVLLLVVNAAQVKQILFGEGPAPKLRPGTAVMVSSTISADDASRSSNGCWTTGYRCWMRRFPAERPRRRKAR